MVLFHQVLDYLRFWCPKHRAPWSPNPSSPSSSKGTSHVKNAKDKASMGKLPIYIAAVLLFVNIYLASLVPNIMWTSGYLRSPFVYFVSQVWLWILILIVYIDGSILRNQNKLVSCFVLFAGLYDLLAATIFILPFAPPSILSALFLLRWFSALLLMVGGALGIKGAATTEEMRKNSLSQI